MRLIFQKYQSTWDLECFRISQAPKTMSKEIQQTLLDEFLDQKEEKVTGYIDNLNQIEEISLKNKQALKEIKNDFEVFYRHRHPEYFL